MRSINKDNKVMRKVKGIYQKGENFYIDYYVNGWRKREKVGPSLALAETVLRKRKVEIAEGKFLDIRREERVKFNTFADQYLAVHSKQNRSYYTDCKNMDVLKRFFGGKDMQDITALDVQRFKTGRAGEVSVATTNRALALLKSMFNRAVEWKKLTENPCGTVKLFKENNQRLRYLEQEDMKKLLESSKGYLHAIVVTALFTGMRKSEILGLKWKDCDFNRGLIRLIRTKNNETRTLPMNDKVKSALIAVPKHPESPYIFCKKNGEPFGNVRKSFDKLLKVCKIDGFRFHDLRHTYASQLVMNGVDLNTVRELLGHKSLQMTLRYSHLSPDHKRRAVDILSRRMDTIWPPKPGSEKDEKSAVSQLIDNKHVVSRGL